MLRPCLLLLALALCVDAADQTPPPAPADPKNATGTVPAPPPRDDAKVAELRAKLPQAAGIVERDARLWWEGADKTQAVAFTGVDDKGLPEVETECGTVTVQRRLVETGRRDAVTTLLRLAALAKAAGVTGLRLAEGPLTGLHLRNADTVVLEDGVLARTDPPAADRSSELKTLRDSVEALKTQLPQLDMEGPGRRALDACLDKLAEAEHKGDDSEAKRDADDASPEFIRRVVRSGWLRQFFPSTDADDRIEKAVQVAETPLAVKQWKGASGQLAEVRDAFGNGGWILQTRSRSAWLVDHAEPIYFGGMPPLVVVVDLTPGTDPLAPANGTTVRGARLWRLVGSDYVQVGSWTAGKAFECVPGDWDLALVRRGRPPCVENWYPPHVLVTSLQGDVLALAADTGCVTPPRDGSSAEGERFLAEAARALPDAAHLDLIGQHLLRYVYDSPDPRRPTLIGNKQDKGDIHQTALQTLANVSGGMMRGDCDDSAELYQTLVERQGHNKTVQVISLPSHAACAWADKRADAWHVFLLQTGPALEFADADLKQALAKTYKHFDESDTFDPNGLSLSLRFSNENTRGQWRLSYRIFEDPEYARIMIDVQKDWHYSTYQRGIATMEKMIKSNETEGKETANYRELSGLYSFTGQYAKAAEFHQTAIDLTRDDPQSSLYMEIELIGHLFDAGQDHRAREVALDLLEHQIPQQRETLGPALMQVGAQLARILSEHKCRDLALRALRPALGMLNGYIIETFEGDARAGKRRANADEDSGDNPVAGLQTLGDWLEGPRFNQSQWDNHPKLQQCRRLSSLLAGTAIAVLKDTSPADRTGDVDLQLAARVIQTWLDRVAFHDVDDPGEAMFRYASAGEAYGTLLGAERFEPLLEAAAKPASMAALPDRRVGGIAQVAMDASWVRVCTPYWTTRLMELFSRDRDTFDPKEASLYAKRAVEAAAAIAGTPLEHPRIVLQAHLAQVIGALVDHDEATLRARLRYVAQQNDKDLRDDTAQWIGDCARRLPLDWYATVLKCWDETIGESGKQKYFWIAWRAALNKAPAHALLAAQLAADRFGKADPAFLEEYQFMRALLEPKK